MSRDDRTAPPEDPRDDWVGDSLRKPRDEDELPPGFYARARERFEQESGSRGKAPLWLRPLPWMGTVAAAALLALIFLPQLHDSSGELTRPEASLESAAPSAPVAETPIAQPSDDSLALGMEMDEAESDLEIAAEAQDRRKDERSAESVVAENRQDLPTERKSVAKKKLDADVARKEAPEAIADAAPPAKAQASRKRSRASERAQTDSFNESSGLAQLSGLRDAARSYHSAASPEAAISSAWPGPTVPELLLSDWRQGSEIWWIPGEQGVRLVCRVEPEAQTDPGPLQVTVVRVPNPEGGVGPGCLVRLELGGRTANIVFRNAEP